MKTTTKILIILSSIFSVASAFLFRYVWQGIVPNGKGFTFDFSTLGYIALAVVGVATALGAVLYFRFLKTQKLSMAIFFSIAPITLMYGGFVAYTSSVQNMTSLTAQSVKETLRISAVDGGYNSYLWAIIATLVYLISLFVVVIFLCRPLAKVESVTEKLGDGRLKYEDYKVGGGKQFMEIEHSLNKINFQYKERENKVKQTDLNSQENLSKQFFRFIGKTNIVELECGNQVRKSACILLCNLQQKTDDEKELSLQDNFNFINSYLKIVVPLVKKFNGFVDKYLGNGIFAVFGSAKDGLDCSHAIRKAIDAKNRAQRGNINAKITLDFDTVSFGIVGEENKQATIISNDLERLQKVKEISDYIGADFLLTKNVLNGLPQDFLFDFRFVGSVTIEEKQMPLYESLMCYDKRKREKLKKLKNKFENGVQLYCNKNFKQAQEVFEMILHYVPDDNPSYVYFNNCAQKIKMPA